MRIVYGVSGSPFVRKVRVLLKEKGISYELKEVIPFNNQDLEFKKISPLGKVPAYCDGDFTLADSSAICAYIERRHPEPPLYPADPQDYARALWFEEYADTALYAVIGGKIFAPKVLAPILFNQKPDDSAIQKAFDEEIPPLFDYLEGQIKTSDGIVGNRFTIGDVGLATQFVILYYAGYSVDKSRWPKLARYVAQNLGRPSFAEAIAEERRAYICDACVALAGRIMEESSGHQSPLVETSAWRKLLDRARRFCWSRRSAACLQLGVIWSLQEKRFGVS